MLILGAFAKYRKATISFVMFVRPSARNNSAPTGWIIVEFYIWVFFRNIPENIKVLLKSVKNNRYFTWKIMYIYDNISLIYS
jgi:hypothetical protein